LARVATVSVPRAGRSATGGGATAGTVAGGAAGGGSVDGGATGGGSVDGGATGGGSVDGGATGGGAVDGDATGGGAVGAMAAGAGCAESAGGCRSGSLRIASAQMPVRPSTPATAPAMTRRRRLGRAVGVAMAGNQATRDSPTGIVAGRFITSEML
jgi:hypothetical protein